MQFGQTEGILNTMYVHMEDNMDRIVILELLIALCDLKNSLKLVKLCIFFHYT